MEFEAGFAPAIAVGVVPAMVRAVAFGATAGAAEIVVAARRIAFAEGVECVRRLNRK